MIEAVAEALPLGIMLAEVGKTAIQRVPPRVDDFRIGQDKMDEACIDPVIGQLVDEVRFASLALDSRSFDIFGA